MPIKQNNVQGGEKGSYVLGKGDGREGATKKRVLDCSNKHGT